jgi:hypothetical protein
MLATRELAVGTKLHATYKKTVYTCEVVGPLEGNTTPQGNRYRLEDGREFKSLSSAGKAVMNGMAVNGWRFWSQEGEIPSVKTVKPTKVKAVSPAKVQQIRRTRSQKGTPEGQVKWACSSCMSTFLVEGDATPDACPDGHPREVVDDLANVS